MKSIKNFMEELLSDTVKMTLYIDNDSTIKTFKSGQATRKSKYIDIKYHFICDELAKIWFNIKWIKTSENLADILTKPLVNQTFSDLKRRLMKDS